MNIIIKPLTPELTDDYFDFFENRAALSLFFIYTCIIDRFIDLPPLSLFGNYWGSRRKIHFNNAVFPSA